jgi:hypothetical protein
MKRSLGCAGEKCLSRIGATALACVCRPNAPSTGTQTLFDFYASLVSGAAASVRGDHAVF